MRQKHFFFLCFCFQETEPLLTGTSKLKQALGASRTSTNRWTRGSSNYKSIQLNLFYIIKPSLLTNLTAVMCVQSDGVAVLWVQSLRLLTQRLTSQWRNDSAVCLSALEVLGGLAKVGTHTHTHTLSEIKKTLLFFDNFILNFQNLKQKQTQNKQRQTQTGPEKTINANKLALHNTRRIQKAEVDESLQSFAQSG